MASVADPEKGRFRAFLRKSLHNFIINEWARRSAVKRGGIVRKIELEPRLLIEELGDRDQLTPDEEFDRQWAVALLNRVLCELREDYERRGMSEIFKQLKDVMVPGTSQQTYHELAAKLGSNEGAVKALVFRMRRKFRMLLEKEVSQTVGRLDQIDDEIKALFETFARS